MKRFIFLTTVAAAVPMVLPALADDAPTPVDLSTPNKDFAVTMPAPAGATVKDDFGDVDVNSGDGFQVVAHSIAKDIATAKKDIKENTLNKLKQFITETDDTRVYESNVAGQSEFHFVLNVKVGEKTYGIEDNKGLRYTQEQVEAMVKSAKAPAAKA